MLENSGLWGSCAFGKRPLRRHPERSKYHSMIFTKSNPTIGRAPLFRGGIYEKTGVGLPRDPVRFANTFAKAKVRLRKTPPRGILLRSG